MQRVREWPEKVREGKNERGSGLEYGGEGSGKNGINRIVDKGRKMFYFAM
jgi:hypothetical protein